ncbi:A16A1 dehydrogenase, partial [Pomatostomus ruficeps]|nr:A16A1 dehydrogenase [Pomatostomus ruficeps]
MAALAALGAPPVPQIFATMEEGPMPGGINPGEAWLESHGRSLGHFVGGTWLKPPGRTSLECREATGGTGRDREGTRRGQGPGPGWGPGLESGFGVRVRGQGLGQGWGHGLGTVLAAVLDGDRRGTMGALLSLAGGRPLCQTLGADLDLGLRLLQAPAGGAQLGPPGLEGWTPLGVVAVVLGGPCSLPALLWKLGPLLAMGECRGDSWGLGDSLGTLGTTGDSGDKG